VLLHAWYTGDFLSFLPDSWRAVGESAAGISQPVAGESTRWRLEYTPYLPPRSPLEPWLVTALALGAATLAIGIYLREGQTAGVPYRMLLAGLRWFLLLLVLIVLMPQLALWFERQGWPDVVLLIDDSESMSAPDSYQDTTIREAADRIVLDGSAELARPLLNDSDARVADLAQRIQAGPTPADRLKPALELQSHLEPSAKETITRLGQQLVTHSDPAVQAKARKLLAEPPGKAIAIVEDLAGSSKRDVRDPARAALDQCGTYRQAERIVQLCSRQRLALARALMTSPEGHWVEKLLGERKFKVHVFHCSASANRIADVSEANQVEEGVAAINLLRAKGESSHLGKAVRDVLREFRGSSLAGIIMLTDGVTTDGEDLPQAAAHAAQMGVPLFFVGIGDQHEIRDLIVHDLQAEESCFVHDRIVFEAQLTAQGYTNLGPQTVTLSEKTGKGQKELRRETVIPDPKGKPVRFRLTDRPKEAGEKTYVIEVKPLPDEPAPPHNNRLERIVHVREVKPINVLYIEGYPRYEFRFVKSLFERETADDKGTKSVNLKVLLLDADDDFPSQDRTARGDFPTKEELFPPRDDKAKGGFHLVILGDVDPKHPKIEKHHKLLVDFVREHGGGLLAISGERHMPHAWKETALADVLPVQPLNVPVEGPDVQRRDGFKPQLTPVGRLHPMFRFSPDEAENTAIWNRLADIFWFAEGYRLQPAAEVLAVHPRRRSAAPRFGAGDERHPLIVQHFVGAGRCMFFGIDESWRWRWREDELHYNQFWMQTVKYLARSGQTDVKLRLNRSMPYRKGEPIQITVRFPDDQAPPEAKTPVTVRVERRPLDGGDQGEAEIETLNLAKLAGSRATFETIKTQTPPGKYRFTLGSPTVAGPLPRAECLVLPPPGELEKLRMNQADMERAAELTQGRFYSLADAHRLVDEIPPGYRVALNIPGPPWMLWNNFAMFMLVLGLFAGEWILRKRKHLL
jgi:hypothetical protein